MLNRISGAFSNRTAFGYNQIQRNQFQRVSFAATQEQPKPEPAPLPMPLPPVVTPGASPGKPSPAKPGGLPGLPGLPNRKPGEETGNHCGIDPNATLPACFA